MPKNIEDAPPDFVNEMQRIVAKAMHDKALEIATLYRETLVQMILGNRFDLDEDLTGKDNKNRRKYLAKKQKLVGHTTPLVLTGKYAEKIKVFADTALPDAKGRRKERETASNSPRFYVEIQEYNGIYGYYVDVEDVLHDPPPDDSKGIILLAQYYAKNVFKSGTAKKLLQASIEEKKQKIIEKAQARGKEPKMIPMRWLKRALEYGAGPIPARYHWGYVTDIFRSTYGTDAEIWDEVRSNIYNEISQKLGSE